MSMDVVFNASNNPLRNRKLLFGNEVWVDGGANPAASLRSESSDM